MRRFHLPPWSNANAVVLRRCSPLSHEAVRWPVTAPTAPDGAPVYVRVRTHRKVEGRYQHGSRRRTAFSLELDWPAAGDRPAMRVDVPIDAAAHLLAGWLSALSSVHAADRCLLGYGHWGDARLTLERRGDGRLLTADKLLVEVIAPPGWEVPPEWEGAVEVTDDPAWSRPLLTQETWPLTFPPIDPRSRGAGGHAWGIEPTADAALDAAPEPEHRADDGPAS